MSRKNSLDSLSVEHRQAIADLYATCALSRDELPYTADFDQMYERFCRQTAVN